MADDFYGYDDDDEPKGRDNLFLWTVFILLLIGGAFACWLGSFYIFGHPENPRSYKILKKLKKLEPPQRFEVTAAPPGEFLNPQKLYERYARFSRLELENENAELIRTYLRNFKETKRLVTYATGKFVIVNAIELKKTDRFPNGVVALAQASDFPQVLIENVYTTNARNVNSLLSLLQTGAPMRIYRTDDLSAVVHIERLHDGRMLFTLVPLLYGSYGVKGGAGEFSLEPPTELNMEAGLPVIKDAELQDSLKVLAAYRTEHPPESSAPGGAEVNKAPPAPELVRVDTVAPGEPVPLTGAMPPVPVATPIAVGGGKPTPKAATPRIAATGKPTPLQSRNSPTPTPRVLAMYATPIPRIAMTPVPRVAATPMPVATPIPAPQEAQRGTPSGVPLHPFMAQRDPNMVNSGASWKTYAPGRAPAAKTVGLEDVAALADRGEIGEKLYLHGDFRVTASSASRAVLRDANKPDDQSPRVLVEYPPGAAPPQEKEKLSRDSSRPYEIYNVRRGADGVVTIWVREITQ